MASERSMTQHLLYGLRGQAYVAARKSLFEKWKWAIALDFADILQQKGKFTPMDLGMLCRKYLIPVSVMADWLYDLRLIRTCGEKLKDRGLKATQIGVVWK